MKKIIRKIIPKRLILIYHFLVSIFAIIYYNFPAKKMIIIGVTGTKGKTSTINFIWTCLNAGGFKTGIISTANIRIGEKEILNKYHMTMPNSSIIQKTMAEMVKEKCQFCIIETTSEGIKQFRHIGVYYDIAVFTNLTPEHLPSHEGSFEKYKEMKGKMFSTLFKSSKIINRKKIEKIIIANKDSGHCNYFLNFKADKKFTYGIKEKADFTAKNIEEKLDGVEFKIKEKKYKIGILGKFNVYNVLPAIIISQYFEVSDELINKGLNDLKIIQGRMEKIEENQNFTVIVDYAHEKESMTCLLETANNMKKDDSKIIILLGAEGGGRDKNKRSIMGELSAKMADFVIISNVDPYDDNPQEILEDIAKNCERFEKRRNEDLFVIEDRREGIRKALNLAKENDLVLITGKGAEQSMIIGKERIAWDDRNVVREELNNLKNGITTFHR